MSATAVGFVFTALSSSGVLTTVSQIGGAAGVAILGLVFFQALYGADGATPLAAYSAVLAAILPWQVACYLAAAALMLLLPRRALADDPQH